MEFVFGVAGEGYGSGFGRMFELPVASGLSLEGPAIVFETVQHLSNRRGHGWIIVY